MTTPGPPSSCPYHRSNSSSSSPSSTTSAPQHFSRCPVNHEGLSATLNPKNLIPEVGQQPSPGQQIDLPTDRMISSIPKSRNNASERWEYPSPQQFYNALRRKGWETPEEEIETMVDIHNFLNEEAWEQVKKWEALHQTENADGPSLMRFKGRPGDLSPKARILSWFGSPKPFDRHDWYVDRSGKEVRYVIDYYEAPEEIPGVPVFHLDVRPALDSVGSLLDRMRVGSSEILSQLFGGQATPEKQE